MDQQPASLEGSQPAKVGTAISLSLPVNPASYRAQAVTEYRVLSLLSGHSRHISGLFV
jgi:hypothetical protein